MFQNQLSQVLRKVIDILRTSRLKEPFRHEKCPLDNWYVRGTFTSTWKLRQVIKSP